MAKIADHQRKWIHNRNFLARVKGEFPDWMVTVAFYTAVHAIETLFATDKVPCGTSHRTRNETLRQIHRYRKIWEHYRPLYGVSQTVRYDCSADAWIPTDQVKNRLIPEYLYPIEKSVLKLSGLIIDLQPIQWAS